MNHLLKLMDLTAEEMADLLTLAARLKRERKRGVSSTALEGKTLGMIFQKSSTRTRVSFEAGMYQLGGQALFLSSNDLQIGRGEPVQDTARVLSRYLDGLMIRTFEQQEVENFAKYGSIPVINGLTDFAHPCQVLADYMTMQEYKGDLKGKKLAFIGDGNNVAHSLIVGAALLRLRVAIASPKGYWPDETVVSFAREKGGDVLISEDVCEAADNADAVYTDVFASMGQESEAAMRMQAFSGYQVNRDLMNRAREDAIVLHCLPAHRGEEITEEIFEEHAAEIFEEAENRLHVQKAVMLRLMSDQDH